MFDSTLGTPLGNPNVSGESAAHWAPRDPAELAQHLKTVQELPSDERERYWFENIYQGDRMPQLTARATIMGFFLGALMALSNLYIGLKTGWALGVVITSCILSFSITHFTRSAAKMRSKESSSDRKNRLDPGSPWRPARPRS